MFFQKEPLLIAGVSLEGISLLFKGYRTPVQSGPHAGDGVCTRPGCREPWCPRQSLEALHVLCPPQRDHSLN